MTNESGRFFLRPRQLFVCEMTQVSMLKVIIGGVTIQVSVPNREPSFLWGWRSFSQLCYALHQPVRSQLLFASGKSAVGEQLVCGTNNCEPFTFQVDPFTQFGWVEQLRKSTDGQRFRTTD